MGFSPFNDAMFTIVPALVVIGFIVVFGLIIVSGIKGAKQWKRNNDSPVLTVSAVMVTKRMDVSHHHHTGTNDMHHSSSSTSYYATFEIAGGDRMEFGVQATEYGILVEGDKGNLTFQGTRYLGFERTYN